jgi:hypothetical protein
MHSLAELLRFSDEQLADCDLALTHLACAAGLPGSEKIDAERCARKLDELTGATTRYTEDCLADYRAGSGEFAESESKLRMMCLVQVVWRGAGLRYNLAKIPDAVPFDIEDLFIHGALFGPGGTCATLPIVYTAIGRRLGYPLKLVSAWYGKAAHQFCRWEDSRERFNIDANDTGVTFLPDKHYRRFGQDRAEEWAGLYMKSKTPRQELADSMAARAECWKRAGRPRECLDSWTWALSLSPENQCLLGSARGVQRMAAPGEAPAAARLPGSLLEGDPASLSRRSAAPVGAGHHLPGDDRQLAQASPVRVAVVAAFVAR